jgi:predicted ATPase
MITEISLQNFKIFKDKTTFPLNKLNLLTGVNGGGKSTLLQSLLLMRQSIEHDERTTNIIFNGSCVELGTFMDVKNLETSRKEAIVFEFKIEGSYSKNKIWNGKLQYYLIPDNSSDSYNSKIDVISISTSYFAEREVYPESSDFDIYLLNLIPFDRNYRKEEFGYDFENLFFIETEENNEEKFDNAVNFHKIHYIAADRIGPKSYYEKTTLGKFPNVGPRGEHTANILYRFEDDLVNDKLYLGNDAKTLMQQTEEWLKKILGGAKLELKGKDREHTVLNLLFNTQDSEGRYRPSNVGFGYTYILPIVVSGLIAKEGEILIVENPEAHLHPKAQSELTKFLALVASCGVQVFIESHSEHVLNAIRVATLQKEIDIKNDEVSVLYFQNDKKEPFVHLEIDEKGKIDNWVDGFFDQQELDLGEIFKLSRKK